MNALLAAFIFGMSEDKNNCLADNSHHCEAFQSGFRDLCRICAWKELYDLGPQVAICLVPLINRSGS